ncbi:TetR/AcrR family transcriptional regulator [Lentibacillus sp. Marseille-P4043]|uniref:TetR/AcrR family transcriptional regulator n=1 Tax=Lentibacillus sp. Marseille-P4043 TaxID=2040293 RepID=UPI000D0BB7CC|nr:TetR/AcrR family transcriptional regulator [Lentibacillus sp. Marseille-P4043]
MSKRNELMTHAIRLFSEKGFHQTSVQEVAQAVGISKGAFYKYFDSKESIFIEILKQNHERIITEANLLNVSNNLTGKEAFTQKIQIELSHWMENRPFFTVMFNEFPPTENERIADIMKTLRTSMIELHKNSLLDAYGEKIKPFMSDLVIMFEGMLKEYIFTVIIENKNVVVYKLATLIASSIDSIVQSLDQLEPALDEKLFELSHDDLLEEMRKRLKVLEQKISNSPSQQYKKEKLLSSVQLLNEEITNKNPQKFLIEALVGYLKQEKTLEEDILLLKSLLEKFIGEV